MHILNTKSKELKINKNTQKTNINLLRHMLDRAKGGKRHSPSFSKAPQPVTKQVVLSGKMWFASGRQTLCTSLVNSIAEASSTTATSYSWSRTWSPYLSWTIILRTNFFCFGGLSRIPKLAVHLLGSLTLQDVWGYARAIQNNIPKGA